MKDRGQIFIMGLVMMMTVVLIISIFAGQLNMKTKASEETAKENTVREDTVPAKESLSVEESVVADDSSETISQEPEFVTSDSSYFDNALFIGDSRTVGLCEYGTLDNADYFASTGMSIYKLWDETLSVENVGRVTLEELLNVKQYGKIYMMLGINELGYKVEKTIEENQMTIQKMKEQQPDAVIYLCANLHVTKARSGRDELINNKRIDKFNHRLETLTDNKGIYYIDVNEEFDDETGNLRAECTGDDVHVYAKYYQDWCEWLCENTVQRGN